MFAGLDPFTAQFVPDVQIGHLLRSLPEKPRPFAENHRLILRVAIMFFARGLGHVLHRNPDGIFPDLCQ